MNSYIAHGCALWRNVLTAALFVASASVANGQTGAVTTENGFQPNRDYLALQPFESIDTASGNVILTFTDLVLPGNAGRDLKFQRVFNNMRMGDGAQWRFSVSGIPLSVSTPNIPVGASIADSIEGERLWTPAFSMPDGSTQRTNFMNDPDTSTADRLLSTTRWVSTPSFWRYNRIDRTLYLPDALIVQYVVQRRCGGQAETRYELPRQPAVSDELLQRDRGENKRK